MNAELNDMLSQCTGFEWDDGNSRTNWITHRVTPAECEQIFFNHPLFVTNDIQHSDHETQFYALGQTDDTRRLFLIFTIRKSQIRVISARNMNRKEREVYQTL